MPKYTPINDTYDKHVNDARYKAKDYSLIPEFRISEHMDYYVNEKGGDFLADNPNMFSVTGSTIADSSEANFAKIYTNSDFFKDFGKLRREHKDLASATKIELKAHAILNFTPYQGFYPAERTLDLVTLFSQSYGPNMIVSGSPRPIYQTLFGPGILYNTIKSGLAVSHPINYGFLGQGPAYANDDFIAFSGTAEDVGYYVDSGSISQALIDHQVGWDVFGAWQGLFKTSTKAPFLALLEPENYIKNTVYDIVPHPLGALSGSTVIMGDGSPIYTMGMHNFLASSIDFFNNNSSLSSLVSAHDKQGSYFQMDLNKLYKMRLYLRACENFSIEDIIDEAADGFNVPGYGINSRYFEAMAAMSLTASTEFSKPTFSMFDRPNFDADDLPDGTNSNFNPDKSTYKHAGSAFGPPHVPSRCQAIFSTAAGNKIYHFHTYGFTGYEAYTPPYYEGFSFVEFEFKPFDENGNEIYDLTDTRSRRFTLDEIFSNLTSSYYRYSTTPVVDYFGGYFIYSNLRGQDYDPGWAGSLERLNQFVGISSSNGYAGPGGIISIQNMLHNSLNDSIIDKGKIRNKQVIYDDSGLPIEIRDDVNAGDRWYIQPKFESPIFDYSNVECTPDLPSSGSQNIGRGVWLNYGNDLQENQGLFMQIADAPVNFISGTQLALYGGLVNDILQLEPTVNFGEIKSPTTASLADVLGFPKEPVRIGNISNKRTISEAIVAIPFIDIGARRRFFKLDRDLVDDALKGNPVGNSVRKTVQAMQKYVIPPKFDWITYDGKNGRSKVNPIAMYFFEFDYDFDREDIKRIWHNTAPDPRMKEATATISHELLENELLDGFHDKLRWMVFKVKQKGAWNYYEKTLDASDDQRFQFKFNVNSQEAVPEYSYNWPYDFMSIIEFGKIEANVAIESPEAARQRRDKLDPKKIVKPRLRTNIGTDDLLAAANEFKPATSENVVNFNRLQSSALTQDNETRELINEITTSEEFQSQITTSFQTVSSLLSAGSAPSAPSNVSADEEPQSAPSAPSNVGFGGRLSAPTSLNIDED